MPLRHTTDATWLNDGTGWVAGAQPFFGARVPSRRHLRAGWKRMLRRWSVLLCLALITYGWLTNWLATAWAVVLAVAVVAGIWADSAYRWLRGWRHRREVVGPLHVALAPVLGYAAERERACDRVWVPSDYRGRDGAMARVALPLRVYAGPDEDEGGWSYRSSRSAMRATTEGVVCEKLGLSASEVRFSWAMTGSRPAVEVRSLPRVPAVARAADVAADLAALPESELMLGVTRDEKLVTTDLDSETPHILASMGTGAGKSFFARGVAAQVLHNGGRVLVLDPKRTSQRWLRDHPHVRYFRDVEDIHNELVYLGDEIIRRQTVADEDESAYIGPRILVVAEELNMLSGKLREYWAANKPKSTSGPSPAVIALNEVAYTGREPKLNALCIAQYGDARTMGGGASRENYGCRILGRASRNAWRMLAPEVGKVPSKSTRRGRFHVVINDSAVETQGLLWTDEFAREWAWGCFPDGMAPLASPLSPEAFYQGRNLGTVSDVPTGEGETSTLQGSQGPALKLPGQAHWLMPVEGVGKVAGSSWESVWEDFASAHMDDSGVAIKGGSQSVGDVSSRPAVEPEAVSLKEAAEMGIVTLSDTPMKTHEIMKSARKRESGFPAPIMKRGVTQLFAPEELRVWARNRERA